MNILFAEHMNGMLYTIDYTGALNKTNLSTGETSRVGNAVYKNTKFFFPYHSKLYSIETDGSMTEIDPITATWTNKSSIGYWSTIEKVTVVGNNFFAIENGAFYYYPGLDTRLRKQIGGSDFYETGMLLESDTTLHSLIRDGSLYQISLTKGEWKRIGKGKSREWKAGITAEVVNNKIYTIETGGSLYETSLPEGTRKLLDAGQLERGRTLIADSGKLYAITREGNLFEIVIN
jgi:hypothetical protein